MALWLASKLRLFLEWLTLPLLLTAMQLPQVTIHVQLYVSLPHALQHLNARV